MTLSKSGYFGAGGGGKNGATVDLWAASRFSIPPNENAPVPDADPPDAGPVVTGVNFGGPGSYRIENVPSVQDYYLRVQYGGLAIWSECSAGTLAGVPTGQIGPGGILAHLKYTPPSSSYTISSSALAAIDPTNLTMTFIAPGSASVRITWSAMINDLTPFGTTLGVILDSGGGTFGYDVNLAAGSPFNERAFYDDIVTGLTVGDSYTATLAASAYSPGPIYIQQEQIVGFVTQL